jgi:hypothetical protein
MTNLHQNENRGRDSTGRPLSTADLAAAAQRPSDPATGEAASSTEQWRNSQRQTRGDAQRDMESAQRDVPREAQREASRQTAGAGERAPDIRDDEDTGTFQALDPNRRGTPSPATREPTLSGKANSSAEPTGPAPTTQGANSNSRAGADSADQGEALEPLFTPDRAETYRTRWLSIQSSFVDDPRQAVRSGDELVAQVMTNLASTFAEERHRMEAQLDETGEGTTENLRVALRRYRSFFERLLSL